MFIRDAFACVVGSFCDWLCVFFRVCMFVFVFVFFLFFCQRSWKLVPKQTALLSAESYVSRSIGFEVAVIAAVQQDKTTDTDHKTLKASFDLTFEVWIYGAYD